MSKKILLVEDDNNLREIYGARLEAEGYNIVSAHDGEEALALAIKERPDMILTDVMMPKISGFDMVDILRSTTETKDIKVIIMTALSQPEDQQRGEQLGADKYLVKSQVTLEDVVKSVHEVLGDQTTSNSEGTIPAQPPASSNPNPSPVAPSQPTPPTPTPAPQPQTSPQQATPTPTPPVASRFVNPVTTSPQSPPVQATTSPSPVVSAPIPQPAFAPEPQTPADDGPKPAVPQKQGSNRVIQPLASSEQAPTFQELVDRELAKEADTTPQPTTPPANPPV